MRKFFLIVGLYIGFGLVFLHGSAFAKQKQSNYERNKICFGDTISVILKAKAGNGPVKLTIPTELFGSDRMYQKDLELAVGIDDNYRFKEDKWPYCAKSPIELNGSSFGFFFGLGIGENTQGKPIDPVWRDIHLKSSKASKSIIDAAWGVNFEVSPSKGGLNGQTFADLQKTRAWLNEKKENGELIDSGSGFLSLHPSQVPTDAPTSNLIFLSPESMTEPATKLPIVYDCSNIGTTCWTYYEFSGGVTVFYDFNYEVVLKSDWPKLDAQIRSMALEFIDDPRIKKLNAAGN
jgi:hypothetical protein